MRSYSLLDQAVSHGGVLYVLGGVTGSSGTTENEKVFRLTDSSQWQELAGVQVTTGALRVFSPAVQTTEDKLFC